MIQDRIKATIVADPKERAAILQKQDSLLVAGLIAKSNRILTSISTHKFPIDIFPDTISVEEGRVNVIIRDFFLSSHVYTVDIKNIANVIINTAPFFAQLVIVSKTFAENEIRVNNLWKDEAVYVRRLIEGLRIFESKQIDTSVYSLKDLVGKLEDLSKTEIVT